MADIAQTGFRSDSRGITHRCARLRLATEAAVPPKSLAAVSDAGNMDLWQGITFLPVEDPTSQDKRAPL